MAEEKQIDQSGVPGGGAGRVEDVSGSPIYPLSGPVPDEMKDAPVREPGSWGQGDRGPEGYYDHGSSELSKMNGILVGGLESDEEEMPQEPKEGT